MRKRKEDIGDPKEWEVAGFRKNGAYHLVNFKLQNSNTQIGFFVHNVPQNLSDEEDVALRGAMYLICAEHGFPRKMAWPNHESTGEPLPSGTREKVRRGDHEAWQLFVGSKHSNFEREAVDS
jgi:hypothetical protein